jgi:hypothetical protein
MLELNERYSDVTVRIMVVKSARGDTPTTATLFANLSINKMMDSINRERHTIVAQKFIKMRAPNYSGGMGATEQNTVPAGVFIAAGIGAQGVLSRATKIVKIYIPGSKFGRNGVIRYENQGDKQKFFDYNVLVYAYANYSTHLSGTVQSYNVVAVGDYVKQLYFTDA